MTISRLPMDPSYRMKRLGIRIESVRHHEEVLKFDIVRRMKATGENIYHRNRYSRLAVDSSVFHNGSPRSRPDARMQAQETASIAFAPSRDLSGVPSSSIIRCVG